jgi:citrate synthase
METTQLETGLSFVDGERGFLLLRGKTLAELAADPSLEAVATLLWTDVEPAHADSLLERAVAERAFGEARVRAFELLPTLGAALALPDAMDGLRASLAQLSAEPPADSAAQSDADGQRAAQLVRAGARLAGATAVFASAWFRRSQGLAAVPPDPTLPHAADYLRMLRGAPPEPAAARALATYLVTVADHGMNASTYAARVVASTGSDAVSAIVAGVGALKGPLHGGAPGPVLDMLDAIASPERAERWLEAELAAGRRIMGMGHRIYRVRDPRAAVLEAALEELERSGAPGGRLPLARAVERRASALLERRHPTRPLRTNVEFFTAILLDALGIDRRLFTPTFAVGRVVGWYAHVLEQRRSGKLIRPDSRYVGPAHASSAQ